jgi:hypothetical protein
MNNLERVDVISRIGRELQERMDFQEVRAYLQGYGVDTTPEYVGPNSKWAYVKEMLAGATSELVARMAQELGLSAENSERDVTGRGRPAGTTARVYFSQRGKGDRSLSAAQLQRLVLTLYADFEAGYYFQEATGYHCVDAGFVPGFMGHDPQRYAFLRLECDGLWPPDERREYAETEFFDLVEFLHDLVSKPLEGEDHTYGDCGWHGETWDRLAGQREFRERVNPLLSRYSTGWVLSQQGEVLALGEPGLTELLERSLPRHDPQNVENRVDAAIRKYRRHHSSMDDRRDAVRGLADVLEFLRPQVKQVLVKKDENDLFDLANNFGLRHHRKGQKTDYDEAVWLSWMFYFYLSTIHAVLHLLQRSGV